MIIGGAAAVIGTPFGVFWSGNDSDAQSVPQAVALINSEFLRKSIRYRPRTYGQCGNSSRADAAATSITNWTDVVAVFAVKTAGADAELLML